MARAGAFVPFTTEQLAFTRMRFDRDGKLVALMTPLSGGQGYYVVPWPMLPDMVMMSVFDRVLHEDLNDMIEVDPAYVRKRVLSIQRRGFCGPRAADEARLAMESDDRRRSEVYLALLERAADGIDGKPVAHRSGRPDLPTLLQKMRGLAIKLSLRPEALQRATQEWAAHMMLFGLNLPGLEGPLRIQTAALSQQANDLLTWSAGEHPEYAEIGRTCAVAAEKGAKLATGLLQEIDVAVGEPVPTIVKWQERSARLRMLINAASATVQSWWAATEEWRDASERRDRHAMRHCIGKLSRLLTILSPETANRPAGQANWQPQVVSDASNDTAEEAAGAAAAAAEEETTERTRRAAISRAQQLRVAVMERAGDSAVIARLMCGSFMDLVSDGVDPRPGDLRAETFDIAAGLLRRTWSRMELEVFDSLAMIAHEPANFAQSVRQLRKSAIRGLMPYFGPEAELTAEQVEDLAGSEEQHRELRRLLGAALCSSHFDALLVDLPPAPVPWLTMTDIRRIIRELERCAATSVEGAVTLLHMTMRQLSDQVQVVQILRIMAADKLVKVLNHPDMASIVAAIIHYVEGQATALVDELTRFEGALDLNDALSRFVDAIRTSGTATVVRHDGAMSRRVKAANQTVVEAFRAGLVDAGPKWMDRAFPRVARDRDAWVEEESAPTVDLNESLDIVALHKLERLLDLLPVLSDLSSSLGIETDCAILEGRMRDATNALVAAVREALMHAGAAQSRNLAPHLIYATWLTERVVGTDQADKLRRRAAPLLELK